MTVRARHRSRRVRLDDPGRRLPLLGRVVSGPRLALDVQAAEEDAPKWQHVATEGEFKGYAGGELPFAFTVETFNQIVKNFRARPDFEMGPDGVGTNGIVQWDFHHASEAPPDVVAQSGAPAQGWVLDLRVQTGADGKAELWALTEWLDLAKQYIKNKQYKWASVAVALDAVDPVTGTNIGAILTSIAITNQPFIEGMTELAAERDGTPAAPQNRGQGRKVGLDYYYQASSIEEAKGQIRRCLGLPITATAAEIAKSLLGLLQIVSGGEDAEEGTGIDADELIGGFRTILGLPLLTPLVDVAQQTLSLFDTDGMQSGGETETGTGDGESIPGATTTSRPAAAAAAPERSPQAAVLAENEQRRKQMDLLTLIAKELGVQPTQEAVMASVRGLVDIRSGLVEGLALERYTADSRIADAAKEIPKIRASRASAIAAIAVICSVPTQIIPKAVRLARIALDGTTGDKEPDADDAGKGKADALISKLGALFKGAGIEDPDRAVGQIVKTLTDAAALEDQMPELSELRKYTQAAKAEAEAGAVAATLRHYYEDDETHKDALVALYRQVGQKKFLEKYPPPAPEGDGLEDDVLVEPGLERTRNAEPAAPTMAGVRAALGGGQRVKATRETTEAHGEIVDLSMYPGVNDSERAIHAARAILGADYEKQPGGYDKLCAYAFSAKTKGKFVNLSTQR